jgi:AcrR family transcriptional regulator
MTEKRRGRPPSADDRQVYEALLEAAESLLETRTSEEITVREITTLAGVNPAMISYYFENKEGLFVALVEFLFSEWVRHIGTLRDEVKSVADQPTRRFVDAVDQCFYQHRGIHWLLSREIRQRDSAIYTVFRKRLASRTAVATRQFLQHMGELGIYRTDVDLRYITFAISSISTHPLSIAPQLERSYDFGLEDLLSEQWREFLIESIDRLLRP